MSLYSLKVHRLPILPAVSHTGQEQRTSVAPGHHTITRHTVGTMLREAASVYRHHACLYKTIELEPFAHPQSAYILQFAFIQFDLSHFRFNLIR